MKANTMFAAMLLALLAGITHAHDDSHHRKAVDVSKAEQMPFGRAGDPKAVTRTVKITMSDTMRFSPATLKFKQGETVRFVVRNDGKTLHEMVLGTDEELAKHAELMRKFPDMEHGEPYMVHVQPGRTEDFVWTFNRAGEFSYGCLVPGHFESGMVGKITVR